MRKRMSTVAIAVIAILLVIIIPVSWYVSGRNGLITLEQELEGSWAQVENQMQRRYDLIPNLVETVKGYASQEEEIFTQIAEARSRLSGATDPQAASQASGQIESALSRLLVVVENYPELKSNANFIALQDELAGTENRLAIARMNYNDMVKDFNTQIRLFPRSIIASGMGLEKQEYFQISEGATQAPSVSFE